MVEYALALPFLVFLLLGAIDLLLAMHNVGVIKEAVAAGARRGAVGGDTAGVLDEIYDRIRDRYYDGYLLEGTILSTTSDTAAPDTQGFIVSYRTSPARVDYFRVEGTYRIAFLGPVAGDVLSIRLPIVAEVPRERADLLFKDDFEDGDTVGWTFSTGANSGSKTVSTASPFAGTRHLRFGGVSNQTAAHAYVTVNASSREAVRVGFRHKGVYVGSPGGLQKFTVEVSTDSGANYDIVGAWYDSNVPTSYAEAYFVLTPPLYQMSSTMRVRWRWYLTSASHYWDIDDVRIEEAF